jgi:hypothetical protein
MLRDVSDIDALVCVNSPFLKNGATLYARFWYMYSEEKKIDLFFKDTKKNNEWNNEVLSFLKKRSQNHNILSS